MEVTPRRKRPSSASSPCKDARAKIQGEYSSHNTPNFFSSQHAFRAHRRQVAIQNKNQQIARLKAEIDKLKSQSPVEKIVEVVKIKDVAVDLPEHIEKAMQAKLAEVRLELQHDSEAMVVKALQKQQEALEMTQADLRQTKQELAEWKT